jgi:hypothetical protein
MKETGNLIWAYLVHLSFNMWADRHASDWGLEHISARPLLRFDSSLWDDLLLQLAQVGANMLLIDLGDGVQYESHPEIAVHGAWTTGHLRRELARVREMGLEPIPKLNFSASHDAWLGPYSRCVSTDTYYRVCRELVAEVIELFDRPRFFHLGMDEETAQHQRYYEHVVVRQYDLWWHDLLYLVGEVQRRGVRPWIWSDYLWHYPDAFFQRMPKSVLQSNWYYGAEFGAEVEHVRAYLDLDARGYDQVPTGSNWSVPENLARTVAFCREYVAGPRLLGFLQTVWKPTLEVCREQHMQALELLGQALTSAQP